MTTTTERTPVTEFTILPYDMSNDTFENFDVWAVTNTDGELVFVALTKSECETWVASEGTP